MIKHINGMAIIMKIEGISGILPAKYMEVFLPLTLFKYEVPHPINHKNIHVHRLIYLYLIQLSIFKTWILPLIKISIKLGQYLFY